MPLPRLARQFTQVTKGFLDERLVNDENARRNMLARAESIVAQARAEQAGAQTESIRQRTGELQETEPIRAEALSLVNEQTGVRTQGLIGTEQRTGEVHDITTPVLSEQAEIDSLLNKSLINQIKMALNLTDPVTGQSIDDLGAKKLMDESILGILNMQREIKQSRALISGAGQRAVDVAEGEAATGRLQTAVADQQIQIVNKLNAMNYPALAAEAQIEDVHFDKDTKAFARRVIVARQLPLEQLKNAKTAFEIELFEELDALKLGNEAAGLSIDAAKEQLKTIRLEVEASGFTPAHQTRMMGILKDLDAKGVDTLNPDGTLTPLGSDLFLNGTNHGIGPSSPEELGARMIQEPFLASIAELDEILNDPNETAERKALARQSKNQVALSYAALLKSGRGGGTGAGTAGIADKVIASTREKIAGSFILVDDNKNITLDKNYKKMLEDLSDKSQAGFVSASRYLGMLDSGVASARIRGEGETTITSRQLWEEFNSDESIHQLDEFIGKRLKDQKISPASRQYLEPIIGELPENATYTTEPAALNEMLPSTIIERTLSGRPGDTGSITQVGSLQPGAITPEQTAGILGGGADTSQGIGGYNYAKRGADGKLYGVEDRFKDDEGVVDLKLARLRLENPKLDHLSDNQFRIRKGLEEIIPGVIKGVGQGVKAAKGKRSMDRVTKRQLQGIISNNENLEPLPTR